MLLPCQVAQPSQLADGPPAPRCIADGDLVVVYENYASIRAVYVDAKATFSNRYGRFRHRDWIGRPFGCKARAAPPDSGWVYLLAPTPELWTLVLRHRTQILYVADISLVVAHLGLRPGSVVFESGTGSGSLTHSLARAVAPGGHVHTFDFHAQRAAEAAAEFGRHGLAGLVTVAQRNIEDGGFPAALAGQADAVFLDLPGPWKVVPSAAACLREGGMFCAFSPCIEQVQRTCGALDRLGFVDLQTLEVLLRAYEVSTESLATDAAHAVQPNKAGKKRSWSAASAAAGTAAGASELPPGSAPAQQQQQQQQPQPQHQQQQQQQQQPGAPAHVQQVVARPTMDARGHTGYLTFARKFVPALPLLAGSSDGEGEGEGEEAEDDAAGEDEEGTEAGAGAAAAAAVADEQG